LIRKPGRQEREKWRSRISKTFTFPESLHVELTPLGVHVTVLPVAPTETPVLAKLGLTPEIMPMKPMKVEQCVSEGRKALRDNRSLIIPGRTNRILDALVPASVTRTMMAKMFEKTFADRSVPAKSL
jgi:short-subunit dehydrogenase